MNVQKNDPQKAKKFFEDKLSFTVGPVEVQHKLEERAGGFVIVDVRAEEDYMKGHVPSAVNCPKDKWDSLKGLDKNKLNILYCYTQTCHLAATAAVRFASEGYSVVEMEGGFKTWKDSGMPIETPQPAGIAS